ncbi:hypothetical protein A2U01_0012439, partial [Trifolium medium]|nr:hypothetical protein [Trifolium medium]
IVMPHAPATTPCALISLGCYKPRARPTEQIHQYSSVSLPDIGNLEQTASPA